MKLKSVYLENFRGYQNPMNVEFDDLTTFIGKNDIGKSTILEVLNVFLIMILSKLNHKMLMYMVAIKWLLR